MPTPSEAAAVPRRGGRLLRVAVGLLVLRVLRARRGDGLPPSPAEPAVAGRTAGVLPVLRSTAWAPVPGRPRLAGVHGGSVRHGALSGLDGEQPLPGGRLVVGRDPQAGVRLDHPTVSPRHALLEVQPDGVVTVQDLGTVNGVLVDGVPVVRAQLHDGNRLDLGEVQLVFRTDPPADDGGRQGGELGEQPHQRREGRD